MRRFRDRTAAGLRLAPLVAELGLVDPLVLALPRGGVPVAAPVAQRLGSPLDVLVAHKVGAPGQPEVAIGAVAERGTTVGDPATQRLVGVDPDQFAAMAAAELAAVRARTRLYRGDGPAPVVTGRDVVVVDDGLATGLTARAALTEVAAAAPSRLVLAVPVAASQASAELRGLADHVVCVLEPDDLVAVGRWYEDFSQTSDEEVLRLLGRRA